MGVLSTIYQFLTKDTPVTIDASYAPNGVDRRFIDNQIQGVQQHLIDSLIQSRHATWFRTTVALNVGDVVCSAGTLASDAFQLVTLALPTALGAAGQAIGVIAIGAAAGGLVLVVTSGTLSPTITNLTAGAAGVVRVSAVGRCERIATISIADYRVGVVDAAGVLTVSTAPSPATAGGFLNLDPRKFGCPCDGIHDDLPGWNLMMASIPVAGGAVVHIPNGPMFFSDNVYINKDLRIKGFAGGNFNSVSGSTFMFPAGRGLFIDGAAVSLSRTGVSSGGDSTTIEDVTIKSRLLLWPFVNTSQVSAAGGPAFVQNPGVSPQAAGLGISINDQMGGQRVDGHFYELGSVMMRGATANVDCLFRCTRAGVSAGTLGNGLQVTNEPVGFQSTVAGVVFSDGTAQFTSEMVPQDYLPPKGPFAVTGAASGTSSRVRLTVPAGNNLATGDTVTVSGITGTGGLPAAANVTTTINVIDSTHIDLVGTTFVGAYTSGGTVNVAGHTYRVGDRQNNPGINQWYFECISPGTATLPMFDNNFQFPAYYAGAPRIKQGAFAAIGALAAGKLVVSGLSGIDAAWFGGIIKINTAASGANNGYFVISNFDAAVIGAAVGTAGVVRLQYSAAHGFTTGDSVTTTGITGTGGLPAAANVTTTINVIDTTHVDLVGTTFVGVYTSGGTSIDNSSASQGKIKIFNASGVASDANSGLISWTQNNEWFGDAPNSQLIWQPKTHTGITITAQIGRFTKTIVYEFSNCGAMLLSTSHQPADTVLAYSDYFEIESCQIWLCGKGMMLTGFDTNGCRIRNVRSFYLATGRNQHDTTTIGAGGFLIHDKSLQNTAYGCYATDRIGGGAGPAYYTEPVSRMSLYDCDSEHTFQDVFQGLNNIYRASFIGINFAASNSQLQVWDITDQNTGSYQLRISTTTNTVNQILCIVQSMPDNTTDRYVVVIEGKRNGNHSSYLTAVCVADRGRNNGAAAESGADTWTVTTWGAENSLAGTTFDFTTAFAAFLVRVNNPPSVQVDWSVTIQYTRRTS